MPAGYCGRGPANRGIRPGGPDARVLPKEIEIPTLPRKAGNADHRRTIAERPPIRVSDAMPPAKGEPEDRSLTIGIARQPWCDIAEMGSGHVRLPDFDPGADALCPDRPPNGAPLHMSLARPPARVAGRRQRRGQPPHRRCVPSATRPIRATTSPRCASRS